MTIAFDLGRKATKQLKQQIKDGAKGVKCPTSGVGFPGGKK